MTDLLDTAIKAHYDRQELSDEKLDAILAMAARETDRPVASPAAPAPPRSSERVWYARLAAMAAMLLLGFGLFHVWFTERDLSHRVLGEIAMNHLEELSVEVASADYAAVQGSLDQLEFSILPPASVRQRFELIGGRYCSIEGGLAAQLKLRDRETGQVETLYATRLTDALKGIAPQESLHDDVRISLWSEGDVFFGLAADPSPE